MKLQLTVLFFFFTVLFSLSLQSQTIPLKGVVRDADSFEPLTGASVTLKGTTLGSSTNEEGEFSFSIPKDSILLLNVSIIGYEEFETEINTAEHDSLFFMIELEEEHLEEEEFIVTATRTVRAIDDVPVRVEAIPQEEVEEKLLMTPSNVAMLLNESTGMRVQTTSATSNSANLRIQGLAGRYTQLLTDGIPNFGGLSSGFSLTQLPPLNLRQVEVVKGATSALYGTDAISGVVNFITKVPQPEEEFQALVNATTQNGFDVATFYSKQHGDIGTTILVSRNTQDHALVDDDMFADVPEFKRFLVTPKLTYNFSEQLSAIVSFGYMEEERTGGILGFTSQPLTNPLYVETINTNRTDVAGSTKYEPSPDKALLFKFATAQLKRDAVFGTLPFNATQSLFYSELQYTVDYEKQTLVLGAAFTSDILTDRTTTHSLPLDYRYNSFGLFVQDELALTEITTILLSGRLDAHNEFGTFITPKISAMVRPSSSLTMRLGIGTGFKAPTIFVEEIEETRYQNIKTTGNLSAEGSQSLSFDVNWKTLIGEVGVTTNAALYLTNIDRALIADDDSLAQNILYLRNADDRTFSRGGELSLKLAYEDFKLSLGYTYTFATQNDRNRIYELALNPRHSFGAILFYENHHQKFKIGLENYWTGTQRLERNPWRDYSPSYWITGLIAEKGFGIVRLFVNFENIFDTRQTRFEPIIDGDQLSTFRTLPIYAPLEGRVINGGVRLIL
ncbi:MAG: TonB-dependent receptor [Ignavibacteriae bacterium]|nr:TonB-dependent receptor [Ignavibacteriota bacterium]